MPIEIQCWAEEKKGGVSFTGRVQSLRQSFPSSRTLRILRGGEDDDLHVQR